MTIYWLLQEKDTLPLIYAVNHWNDTRFQLVDISIEKVDRSLAVKVWFKAEYSRPPQGQEITITGTITVDRSVNLQAAAKLIVDAFVTEELLERQTQDRLISQLVSDYKRQS
nr:hypothetical protein [uncultured Arsenicibacter sp.]